MKCCHTTKIAAVSLLRSVRSLPQPSVDSENCVANCITQFSHDVGRNSFGMQKSLMSVRFGTSVQYVSVHIVDVEWSTKALR